MVTADISSEDPQHPIENALLGTGEGGWRASEPGPQVLRLRFDQPQRLRRIEVSFVEPQVTRTHEFVLRWSPDRGAAFHEIVRQQWNFSPDGAPVETEDYQVDLEGVTALELAINPDISGIGAYATLARLRLA